MENILIILTGKKILMKKKNILLKPYYMTIICYVRTSQHIKNIQFSGNFYFNSKFCSIKQTFLNIVADNYDSSQVVFVHLLKIQFHKNPLNIPINNHFCFWYVLLDMWVTTFKNQYPVENNSIGEIISLQRILLKILRGFYRNTTIVIKETITNVVINYLSHGLLYGI